jgi:hypothetical protein
LSIKNHPEFLIGLRDGFARDWRTPFLWLLSACGASLVDCVMIGMVAGCARHHANHHTPKRLERDLLWSKRPSLLSR